MKVAPAKGPSEGQAKATELDGGTENASERKRTLATFLAREKQPRETFQSDADELAFAAEVDALFGEGVYQAMELREEAENLVQLLSGEGFPNGLRALFVAKTRRALKAVRGDASGDEDARIAIAESLDRYSRDDDEERAVTHWRLWVLGRGMDLRPGSPEAWRTAFLAWKNKAGGRRGAPSKWTAINDLARSCGIASLGNPASYKALWNDRQREERERYREGLTTTFRSLERAVGALRTSDSPKGFPPNR